MGNLTLNKKQIQVILNEIAEKEGVHYIYMYDLLCKEDFIDGLHPNASGHEKIFEKVKDFLIEKKLIEL